MLWLLFERFGWRKKAHFIYLFLTVDWWSVSSRVCRPARGVQPSGGEHLQYCCLNVSTMEWWTVFMLGMYNRFIALISLYYIKDNYNPRCRFTTLTMDLQFIIWQLHCCVSMIIIIFDNKVVPEISFSLDYNDCAMFTFFSFVALEDH